MGLVDDLEVVLSPLGKSLADVFTGLFTGSEEVGGEDSLTREQRLRQMLYGPNAVDPSLYAPGWHPEPWPMPGGSGALPDAVDRAGGAYQQAGDAAAVADARLAETLKQIFASNEALQSKVESIIANVETTRKTIAANPALANDPQVLKQFQDFVHVRLGEIESLMDAAKLDSAKQATVLAALKDDYRAAAAAAAGQPTKPGSQGGGGDPVGGGGGGGDTGGGGTAAGGGGDPGSGAGGLADPLAGMALPGGLGAMADPMSMLGPAVSGMSSIPGALGGLASSLPMGALGMAPLASQLAGNGPGEGFREDAPREGARPADFVDDHRKDGDGSTKTDDATQRGSAETKPEASVAPLSGQTPVGAVPASAGGDPALVVQMPDGSPVTATSGQHASAMRAVMSGASVTDGWKAAHVDLPPPGTPVTEPADPTHLPPGAVAQFKTREPVMYMGNGKIWLDGQLQPQTALPTADFLGWVDPRQQQAGVAAVLAPSSRAPAGA